MKFLGNILIYIWLFIVFMASGLGGGQFSFSGFFGALLIALPLAIAGSWLIDKAEGGVQVDLDKEAQSLLSEGNASQEFFFLYLRPFSSTNAYRLSDAHLNLFSWELWERDGFDDIERIIARSLRPTAKFVALGKPGEHRGAARVLTTDAEWQTEVAALISAAKLVLIIPSHKPGTLWELEFLKKEGYLSKTIFIVPPLENSMYVSNREDAVADWLLTAEACKRIDIPVPEPTPLGGALYKLRVEGGGLDVRALPFPDPVAWMKAFQSLLDADVQPHSFSDYGALDKGVHV